MTKTKAAKQKSNSGLIKMLSNTVIASVSEAILLRSPRPALAGLAMTILILYFVL